MANKFDMIGDIITYLTPEEIAELDSISTSYLPCWVPLVPNQDSSQYEAFNCQADILYYGGAAGGGKSDMIIGLAMTQHLRSIIFRREGTQLVALIERLFEIRKGDRRGWNGQDLILREENGRQIEFGGVKDPGSENKYQGRPHDLIAFDEIPNFLESQFRFLIGWNRTTTPGQRCRVVCTGNPPTDAEGEWVIQYWSPWLDRNHPNPAKPGELRWYAVMDGKDTPVESSNPFTHKGELIAPQSRTFIPSHVEDNPFLLSTGYKATLQSLPEPLRSQMLKGDFTAGKDDNIWQVIPTGWVVEAQERWISDGNRNHPMDSVGADVARGGADKTIIARRHGAWYDKAISFPGAETPDGAITAGLILSNTRDAAPIHVDIIGVGGSVYDHLNENNVQVIAVNNSSNDGLDGEFDKASQMLKFRNKRAFLMWRFRETLDPKSGENIALPPDSELKADLCAPRWKLTAGGILVEDKEEIKKRIGRSPDKGDAYILASINTVKTSVRHQQNFRGKVRGGTWRSL